MPFSRHTNTVATAAATEHAYEFDASVITDAGCVRETNEDSACHVRPNDPARLASRGVLTVVADGMGGHASGEVASRMAVEVVARLYYEGGERDAAAALSRAFHEANHLIHAAALDDARLGGMGTTCTALALRGGEAFAAHVGDSRLYLLRAGELYLLTEDDSAVMEMVKRGIITQAEARHHEDKNVILRALGTSPTVEVTVWKTPFSVRPGDRFLLCTDGLYDLVEDEEIRCALAEAAAPHEACRRLVAHARERGGHDNITAAVVAAATPARHDEARSVPPTRELKRAAREAEEVTK